MWSRAETYRRLRIFETNYGRDGGWHVECRGRRVASLTDPRHADLFWYSYRVESDLKSDEAAKWMTTYEPWNSPDLVFISREFGEVAEFPFTAAGGFEVDTNRLLVRGLYLNLGGPTLWESVLLWFRTFKR